MRFWNPNEGSRGSRYGRKPLDQRGVDARSSTPDELAAFLRVETEGWRHAVKASGATVN